MLFIVYNFQENYINHINSINNDQSNVKFWNMVITINDYVLEKMIYICPFFIMWCYFLSSIDLYRTNVYYLVK